MEVPGIYLKAYSGLDLTKDESEALPSYADRFKTGGLREVDEAEQVKNYVDRLDRQLGWDNNRKFPANTYQRQIDELTAKLATAQKEKDESQKAFDTAVVQLNGQKKLLEAENRTLNEKLKEANDKTIAKGDEGQKEVQKLQAALADLGKEKDEDAKKNADEIAKRNGQITALQKNVSDLERNLERLQAQAKVAQVALLDFDRPKGRIISIDRSGTTGTIDLGSADNVKPQLTFVVCGVGPGGQPIRHRVKNDAGQDMVGEDGKPIEEGKAKVEVLQVLSEHRSQVRITHLRDAERDPVVPGDVLFNPAWSPTLKQRVAIAGVIDLTGTAKSESPDVQERLLRDFIRNLEAQNIQVDAYIDLKELKMKGEISRETDYLILGDTPDVGSDRVIRDGDPRVERAGKVSQVMTEMQKQAGQNAVNLISLRKFLAVTGYALPLERPGTVVPRTTYGSTIRPR